MRHPRFPYPRAFLVAPLLLLVACAPQDEEGEASMAAEEEATPDVAEIRSAIETANRQFVDRINQGDLAAAVEGVYTADAVILPPGGPRVDGRENILAFWNDAGEQMGMESVELETVEVEPLDAGRAYEMGRWTIGTAEGEAQGKYLVIWKRDQDTWRWHVDIWNEGAEGMGGAGAGAGGDSM